MAGWPVCFGSNFNDMDSSRAGDSARQTYASSYQDKTANLLCRKQCEISQMSLTNALSFPFVKINIEGKTKKVYRVSVLT